MDFKYKNIGLSGVAGCGKNTVSLIISKLLSRLELPNHEFSIAKNLKKELSATSSALYGIDSNNCSRDEKNLIRPFLVAHGCIKREMSKGRYWVEKLTPELKKDEINIITDIRFNHYEKDEVSWLKNEINGVLIHISRYEEDKKGSRFFLQPANETERENDPKVKEAANFVLNWPTEMDSTKQIWNCRNLLKWIKNIYV